MRGSPRRKKAFIIACRPAPPPPEAVLDPRSRLQQEYARCPLPPGAAGRRELAWRVARSGRDPLDWLNLAFEEFSAYRFRPGHGALGEALKLDPQLLAAHWLRFQYPLDPAPASMAEAESYRQRWSRGLAAFEALDFRHPRVRAQIWGCVGACTAFYRHYLGDCVAEQARYGALVRRMMAALDPGERPQPPPRARRRVAFVSAYFYQQTVGRLFLPLVEALDPGRFDCHLLHLGDEDDALTARAARAGTLHRGPFSAPQWRQLIAGLQADVIVYLDLGMHPLSQALAALRLAPLQAVLWGHPVTTGMSTVDVALSPAEMEPADGERHYSERLHRLPGLGHGLDLQAGDAGPPRDPQAPLRLLCAQSVYKLMPEQDALFAAILAELPGAELHLIPHPLGEVRQWLQQRMQPTLAAGGIDPARVHLHGYRDLAGFLDLARSCDLNLDSIGWSGGMSSIDLLGLGLPTVTLEGRFMRERQTAALLRIAGLELLTTHDFGGYVERAVRLGRDPQARVAISHQLRAAVPRWNQREAVAASLAAFLAQSD